MQHIYSRMFRVYTFVNSRIFVRKETSHAYAMHGTHRRNWRSHNDARYKHIYKAVKANRQASRLWL